MSRGLKTGGFRMKDEHCKCGNLLGFESKSQGYKDCRWCRSEKEDAKSEESA